jgi:hypothetical protein
MPKQTSFPHPVSAWWIPVALGIGWLLLLVAYLMRAVWPHLDDNFQLVFLGAIWVYYVAFPSLVLAGISILIQFFRLVNWEMRQSQPKE